MLSIIVMNNGLLKATLSGRPRLKNIVNKQFDAVATLATVTMTRVQRV